MKNVLRRSNCTSCPLPAVSAPLVSWVSCLASLKILPHRHWGLNMRGHETPLRQDYKSKRSSGQLTANSQYKISTLAKARGHTIFLWNSEYRDNSPVWEGLHEIWTQAVRGIWPSFYNQADSSIQATKALKFHEVSGTHPCRFLCVLPQTLTCPFTVPNDDSITELTHMVTSLVLSFIALHLYWSGCRFVALEKTRQGWGRSICSKRSGYHSQILRGVRFSQDSFFSCQRAGGLWTDFNNNLSECESRNTASRDLKAASPSALFHGKECFIPQHSNKGVSYTKLSENQTIDGTMINNHLDETSHNFKCRFKNRLLPLRDIRYF